MAPLIQNDFDLTCGQDADLFFEAKTCRTSTPLHESATSATKTSATTATATELRPQEIHRRKIVRSTSLPTQREIYPYGKVRFANTEVFYNVMGRSDYTPCEKRNTWFHFDQLSQMKEKAKWEARMLQRGRLVESPLCSVRGLEPLTTKSPRKERREATYEAIFAEIQFQTKRRFVDDVLVAGACSASSDASAREAREIGAKDASDAKRIYWEESIALKTLKRQHRRSRQASARLCPTGSVVQIEWTRRKTKQQQTASVCPTITLPTHTDKRRRRCSI